MAQAKLESGNFSSNIYRQTNNPLGMGHASRRRQLGKISDIIHEGGNIQKYRNDTQGFRDMFLWYEFGNFPRSVANAAEYVNQLKRRRYFSLSESEYLKRLENYL